MHRFFINNQDIFANEIVLASENAAHAHVLRLKVGEEIVCTISGGNMDYFCKVSSVAKSEVRTHVLKTAQNIAEMPINITLFQALPKGSKMGDIIENTTELGIHTIIPIVTERCVSRHNNDDSQSKISRWQKISESSAKLSHRGYIPKIGDVLSFLEAVEAAQSYDIVFACYEEEKEQSLADFMKSRDVAIVKSMAFFIGSEGGFSPYEADIFAKNLIPTVSIGTRILRSISAASAVLSQLNFYLDLIRKDKP
ncbi:MAG: 16S rRNA (uracil(1498)-N(3))-methyltransferase [Defluviitaleaceae bacterium]|nr:16S rRNA (uracil(1498)-N(3))-methyltransferase [Defluviitaleaceae bacterium]